MRAVKAVVASLAAASVLLVTGCDLPPSFEEKCKDKGGVVEKDRDSCTKTTGTGKKRRTTSGTETDKECLVDGRQVDEDEGSCV